VPAVADSGKEIVPPVGLLADTVAPETTLPEEVTEAVMVTNSPRFNIAPDPGLEIETENACAKAGCATKATVTTEERSSAKDKMEKERENLFKVLQYRFRIQTNNPLLPRIWNSRNISDLFIETSIFSCYHPSIQPEGPWVMSSSLGLFVWRLEG
jgi:hypothetical protein